MIAVVRILVVISVAVFSAAASGCDRDQRPRSKPMTEEDLIEFNKKRAGRESEVLDAFAERHGMDALTTKTGIRYEIYARSGKPDSARTGNAVGVTYKAYLLDSTLVESTGAEPRFFRVGHDDVISGLHEAVTLPALGDSLRMIIPSHLAYGLTGKSPEVPPNAPLLYDLCLVAIR